MQWPHVYWHLHEALPPRQRAAVPWQYKRHIPSDCDSATTPLITVLVLLVQGLERYSLPCPGDQLPIQMQRLSIVCVSV